MAQYTLTEAYSEIYDHRKVEDLFDNLRFIDYMMDEDIEEVVESLVWEFRDYGNTLDEAFEIIDYALEDTIICESYDILAYDILREATVTRGKVQVTSSRNRSSTPGSGSSRITLGRSGSVSPSGSANVTANRSFDSGEVQRRAARIGRIRTARNAVKTLTGPIRSVKQSISGAAGGLGRAAKSLGGAAVEKGKAMLKSLIRRGGQAIYGAGKAIEGSGRAAASAPATTRTARVGRTTVTTTSEPGGSKRQAVGRAVRKVGAAIQRMGKSAKPKGTVLDPSTSDVVRTTAAPRTGPTLDPSASDVVRTTAAPRTGPTRASLGNVRPSKALSGAIARQTAERTPEPGPETRTSSVTRRTRSMGRVTPGSSRRGAGIQNKAPSTPPSTSRKPTRQPRNLFKNTFKSPEAEQRYNELRKNIKEDYDLELLLQYLSEDIISAGYADTIEEAYDVIEDLDENTLSEVLYEYLD